MTHEGYERFMANLGNVGIEDVSPRIVINIDVSDAKSNKKKVKVIGPHETL